MFANITINQKSSNPSKSLKVKEPKKQLTYLEQEAKWAEQDNNRLIKLREANSTIFPYVISIREAIKQNNQSQLVDVLVKYGTEFGFSSIKSEEYLSNNPQKIAKTILEKYFQTDLNTRNSIRSSKMKSMNLTKLKHLSKKEKIHHNEVEDIICTLNPNYQPNYLEVE